jgi:hypothetical protein
MNAITDSAIAIYRRAEGGESENSFPEFRTGAAAVAEYATYTAPSYFPAALLAADLAYDLSDRGEGNRDTTWAKTAISNSQCVAGLALARRDQTTARQMRDRIVELTQVLRESRGPSKP